MGGIGEKEKPSEPIQVQGEIHSEKYIESYKKLIETALNNAGLSPQSIGVTGLESTAASEESQELREKTSIRTGEKKKALWTPALIDLFRKLLIADDLKYNRTPSEYYPNVVFSDYKIETLQEKTATANSGIMSKSWDIKTAVDYVHDDLTEEERVLMRVRIKIENGINVFTADEEEAYRELVREVVQEATETPVIEEVPEEVTEEVVEEEMIE